MDSGRTPAGLLRLWPFVVPPVALAGAAAGWGRDLPGWGLALAGLLLAGAVLGAVHHAETVAHTVGEPFGTLVLAVSVTLIEVGLIITMMISGGSEADSLARDTVFAAVMITCNGVVGAALLVGSLRHGTAVFNAEGAGGLLATTLTLATLSLVLPSYTSSRRGPEFTGPQLAFAAVASLLLYVVFVLVQTVRHREQFVPVRRYGGPLPGFWELAEEEGEGRPPARVAHDAMPGDYEPEHHGPRPTPRQAWVGLGLLLLSLLAVVGLAKLVSPSLKSGVQSLGLPSAVVGVVIALLVLAPETITAVRAARRDEVQTSLNLAYGSAVASIGLTIPVIAAASIWLDGKLLLGLSPTHTVLLALTAVVGVLTVFSGRATLLQAGVHLVIFAGFVFLAFNP
ncbi:Sodium-potassium/proton antiporter ChaA [Streptomyces sp. RB5]|uniref:Sodium-potassium/proton antiporter ChaA n=1 Tax=Streptomyces smaragdinus TaxID=2585196 RepID=A0A7K0CK11_9ACTN|nr:ionic transporter y4hA [Streptomyces smaragdinus]MQY13830.1 Sodium-potassium/proton antiporter ChaA [Streptomyces smaragdinus]